MSFPICLACGVQFGSQEPPPICPVCADPRQFIRLSGQAWTTSHELSIGRMNAFRQHCPGLIGIGTVPKFAIGQRALLLKTSSGNVLWDCISLLDDATQGIIRGLGGLSAIAISHPHYYAAMVDWAHAFRAPIYLHSSDKRWIMRHDPIVRLWTGDSLKLGDEVTLVRCGGHFAGGTVLYWRGGNEGKGAILAGDILQVAPDLKHVSFMRSYPNMIPLPTSAVEHILEALDGFEFESIYGAFFDRNIQTDGKGSLRESALRYIANLTGEAAAGLD